MTSPVFIFSLPRSGSTLLQRILSGHDEIATASEPWIVLPLVYSLKENGVLSEYVHHTSARAVSEFVKGGGYDHYKGELNKFISSLYERYCIDGERYFIDKTPRYYLIIREIKEIFPNAKFIFLFRNPIHVFASIIETFSAGGLGRIYPYEIDLYDGFPHLSDGYRRLKNESYALKYEDLVVSPEKYLKELCSYLDVEYQPKMLSGLAGREVVGEMGDPISENIGRGVDAGGLEKWRGTFSGIYRKCLLKRLMTRLGDEDLAVQGYDRVVLSNEIKSLKGASTTEIKDIVEFNLGRLLRVFKLNIFGGRSYRKWTFRKYLG